MIEFNILPFANNKITNYSGAITVYLLLLWSGTVLKQK